MFFDDEGHKENEVKNYFIQIVVNQEKNAIRKACSSDVEALNLNHKLHFYSIFLIKKKNSGLYLIRLGFFLKRLTAKMKTFVIRSHF